MYLLLSMAIEQEHFYCITIIRTHHKHKLFTDNASFDNLAFTSWRNI